MARKDLLSEAIADAKAVKETALANAKLALEEAFTPKLQSMISAKLAEEADEEDMDEELDSSDLGAGDNAQPDADAASSSDIENDDELTEEEDEMAEEEEPAEESYHEEEVSEEDDVEETYEGEEEVSEEDEYEDDDEDEDEDDDEEDLDLESVIAELEAELEEEDEEEVSEEEDEVSEEEDMDEEEEIDLDEVIRTLKEMEEGDYNEEEEEDLDEEEDTTGELEEAYKTIESLRKTINEVNLLNAKLLYTNKLFRTFDLNENQKVKVLENFDRTSSVREVKLVFSTLAENLNVAKKRKAVVKEGYASKATKSSAPKKQIISEGNEMAARWKKLAGLK